MSSPARSRELLLAIGVAVLLSVTQASAASAQEADIERELSRLIKQAQDNPLGRAAHARTQAASAKVAEAIGSRWARFEATSLLAPSPLIECDNLDCTQTSPRDVSISVAGLYTGLDLSITQPVFTAGKIHYAAQAARAGQAASEALEEELAGSVAIQVAEAYFGFLLAQELLWMLEESLEQIESGRKTLEQMLAEGAPDVTLQDRFRIQALRSEVRSRIADAAHGKAIALASLRALIGDETAILKGGPLEATAFELSSNRAVVTPTLRAARFGVEAQTALETMEKRNFFPDVAIVGGVKWAWAQGVDDPPGAFADDPFNTTSAYVALAARWELDPWVQAARLKQQTAKKIEAIATSEAAERLTRLDRTRALARATLAQERLEALQEGERAGRAWVASVMQASIIGAVSAKELADAYLSYFSSRARVLESTHEWNLAVFELRRQAGEFARPK